MGNHTCNSFWADNKGLHGGLFLVDLESGVISVVFPVYSTHCSQLCSQSLQAHVKLVPSHLSYPCYPPVPAAPAPANTTLQHRLHILATAVRVSLKDLLQEGGVGQQSGLQTGRREVWDGDRRAACSSEGEGGTSGVGTIRPMGAVGGWITEPVVLWWLSTKHL